MAKTTLRAQRLRKDGYALKKKPCKGMSMNSFLACIGRILSGEMTKILFLNIIQHLYSGIWFKLYVHEYVFPRVLDSERICRITLSPTR